MKRYLVLLSIAWLVSMHCVPVQAMNAVDSDKKFQQEPATVDNYIELCEQAQAGDADAMCALAKLQRNVGSEDASTWYRRAAHGENADALYERGRIFACGEGVCKDYQAARHFYMKAGEKGHSGALYALAEIYEMGNGVDKDSRKASQFREMAAKQERQRLAIRIRELNYQRFSMQKKSLLMLSACMLPLLHQGPVWGMKSDKTPQSVLASVCT